MIDLADFQRRFYHDGPDIPETPELQTAEREYRKAFLAAAREAANWHPLTWLSLMLDAELFGPAVRGQPGQPLHQQRP